jgi:hypothetical protein
MPVDGVCDVTTRWYPGEQSLTPASKRQDYSRRIVSELRSKSPVGTETLFIFLDLGAHAVSFGSGFFGEPRMAVDNHFLSRNLASVSDAKRLALEDESSKLKKLLADAMLDNAMLKEIAAKKW